MLLSTSILSNAQNKTSVSIKAQATVIDKSEIELVTIKNMDIYADLAVNGIVTVSPKSDPTAAIMIVKGKSDARFRISFMSEREILNRTGEGKLIMHYDMYGYKSDNQSASEKINAAERALQIGSDGKYFLWIGGTVNISSARPGTYDGEFTIEIEYI